MSPHFRMVVPAAPPAVSVARRAITAFCWQLGIDEKRADDVRLAVSEACNGYVQRATALDTLVLEASVADGSVVVTVQDGAARIACLQDDLGMTLIRECASDVAVSPLPNGTRIKMRFEYAS